MKKTLCSVLILLAAGAGYVIGDELKIFPAVELEFPTVPGGVYRIQASSNLVEWIDHEGPLAGDGTPVDRLYSIKGTPYRFFRLLADLPPTGTLTNYSTCITSRTNPPHEGQPLSASQECLEYDWNGQGILVLQHRNAGFNCCPDRLLGAVAIQDQTLTLTETEIGGLCDCFCLYDLDYEIRNLKPGRYTIEVVPTSYVPPGDPPLRFTVELAGPSQGLECVWRSRYPWDPPPPTGILVAHTSCKGAMTAWAAPAPDLDAPSSSEGCVEFQYAAGTGILRLTHVNAAFNCCAQIIRGDVTLDSRQIRIVESEAGGLCHCLCLYDLDFEILNLSPGTYTIEVSEPLLPADDPKLTVTLDLVAQPAGRICLPRSRYPWGL